MSMKIEKIFPKGFEELIELYQLKIQEGIKFYLNFELENAIYGIENDSSIKAYKKKIEEIYTYTVPRIILIAENDEDKNVLKRFLDKNG